MQVFCPNCGHANDARPDGGKVMCTACTTVFEAPSPARPPPPPPSSPAEDRGAPVTFAPPPPPGGTRERWEGIPTDHLRPSGMTLGTSGELPFHPMAIASLVCGVLCCVPLASPVAVFLAFKALGDLKVDPTRKGRELAIAGLVLGSLGTAAGCLSMLAALLGEA